MLIEKKQVNVDWANLSTIQQTDYLYELIQRILLQDANNRIPVEDNVLLMELDNASKNIKR